MSSLLKQTQYDDLPTSVYATNEALGAAAAAEAEVILQAALADRGEANIIVATGNSQLTFLEALRVKPIDWSKVNVFHMDEYLGLEPSHSASFPAFLRRHFLADITPKAFFPVVSHNRFPEDVCQEYAAALRAHPADLCALGIGENGHLAFNDPPYAEFNDPAWVKVIRLAEASRKQQVGEGHFKSIAEVPTHAITLTIPALLAAKRVLAIVPEARKADAVYCSMRGPISEECPGSILRHTPHAQLFLDRESAARL
ncbi:MAG: 6-phosphogluconolactonase [Thermoflexales bacterium]|nr:6-phosphogluconolactonase [Thermoflexales bacterium]